MGIVYDPIADAQKKKEEQEQAAAGSITLGGGRSSGGESGVGVDTATVATNAPDQGQARQQFGNYIQNSAEGQALSHRLGDFFKSKQQGVLTDTAGDIRRQFRANYSTPITNYTALQNKAQREAQNLSPQEEAQLKVGLGQDYTGPLNYTGTNLTELSRQAIENATKPFEGSNTTTGAQALLSQIPGYTSGGNDRWDALSVGGTAAQEYLNKIKGSLKDEATQQFGQQGVGGTLEQELSGEAAKYDKDVDASRTGLYKSLSDSVNALRSTLVTHAKDLTTAGAAQAKRIKAGLQNKGAGLTNEDWAALGITQSQYNAIQKRVAKLKQPGEQVQTPTEKLLGIHKQTPGKNIDIMKYLKTVAGNYNPINSASAKQLAQLNMLRNITGMVPTFEDQYAGQLPDSAKRSSVSYSYDQLLKDIKAAEKAKTG